MFKYYLISAAVITSVVFSSCIANPENREKQFWDWFVANKTRLFEQTESQEKLFDELLGQLHVVDSGLVFEFSPIRADGIREFTISADGLRKHFPVVKSLVSKAPKIDKWQINAFRQRVPGDSITIKLDKEISLGYSDIYFRYAHDSGEIAIELNVRKLVDDPGFKNAVYILLDGLIGEYDMETQISAIDFVLLDENKVGNLSPLVLLRGLIDENKKQNPN